MLLVLKLILVPSLVAAVTLAARRWGPRVGGWLVAFPVVAGPTLCFYAVDQGTAFAARAAHGTLVGTVAIAACSVVYARLCARWWWLPCVLAGWGAFAVTTALLYRLQPGLFVGLALALASGQIAPRLLPAHQPMPRAVSAPGWDLVLRMLAAGALVFTLTSLASTMGPTLSGFLTTFPVATTTIAVFSQVQRGPDDVVSFFHGFLTSLNNFALFCFIFAVAVEPFGLAWSLVAAIVVLSALHAFTLWSANRLVPDLAVSPRL